MKPCKSGRPKDEVPKFRQYKAYVDAGQKEERLRKLLEKKQKIEMMEAIIHGYETRPNPPFRYLKEISKRLNDCRGQLKVLSTIDPEDIPSEKW